MAVDWGFAGQVGGFGFSLVFSVINHPGGSYLAAGINFI
jgi:hypothetical protein